MMFEISEFSPGNPIFGDRSLIINKLFNDIIQ